jgi:hypothetical protein
MLTENDVMTAMKANYINVKSTGRFGTAPDWEDSKVPTNHIYVPGYGLTTRKQLFGVYLRHCKTNNIPKPKDQYSLELSPLESIIPVKTNTFSNLFEEE